MCEAAKSRVARAYLLRLKLASSKKTVPVAHEARYRLTCVALDRACAETLAGTKDEVWADCSALSVVPTRLPAPSNQSMKSVAAPAWMPCRSTKALAV